MQSIYLISWIGVKGFYFYALSGREEAFYSLCFLCGVALIYYVVSGRKLFFFITVLLWFIMFCLEGSLLWIYFSVVDYVLTGRKLFIASLLYGEYK